MFTGIIEETGVVESVRPTETGIRLSITARKCGGGLKVGHSIAVNGCCLTVAKATSDGRKKFTPQKQKITIKKPKTA